MPEYYDRQGFPIPGDDVMEWARQLENEDRHVAQSRHKGKHGDVWVSTVWLGMNHNFHPHGSPLIFETMAFKIKPRKWNDVIGEIHSAEEIYFDRYSNEEAASNGHRQAVKEVG